MASAPLYETPRRHCFSRLCDTVILQPDQDAANHCALIDWSARCASRSMWLRSKINVAIHQMKRLWRCASDFERPVHCRDADGIAVRRNINALGRSIAANVGHQVARNVGGDLAAFAGAIHAGSLLPRNLYRHFADLFHENIHCEPSVAYPACGRYRSHVRPLQGQRPINPRPTCRRSSLQSK